MQSCSKLLWSFVVLSTSMRYDFVLTERVVLSGLISRNSNYRAHETNHS